MFFIGLRRLQLKLDSPNLLSVHEQDIKVDLSNTISEILNICTENNIKLVILDSFVRLHDKRENDSWEIKNVFTELRKLTAAGITVVFLHHHRKESNKGSNMAHSIRGSSDISAAVDAHFALNRLENKGREVVLYSVKSRFVEEFTPIKIVVEGDGKTTIGFVHGGAYKGGRSAKIEDAKTAVVEALKKLKEQNNLSISVAELVEQFKGTFGESIIRKASNELDGYQLTDTEFLKIDKGHRGKKILTIQTNKITSDLPSFTA